MMNRAIPLPHALARAAEEEARVRPAPAVSPPGPVAEASWRELQAILDEELQRLPERLRTPFALCCIEGHGHGEAPTAHIAKTTAMEPHTVNQMLVVNNFCCDLTPRARSRKALRSWRSSCPNS